MDRVLVCDRRGTVGHGNKGDQVDADHLSELLRRGGLRAVYHGSPQRAALKELARVTLPRKLAALTVHLWKTGEPYEASKRTTAMPT
ncbi:MAG: hypothetical protein C0497_15890 [Gemmatimonas sp.]|nr:hypothetical protein [Gemmatimonas sp.]